MFRIDRELADDVRQFAIARTVEGEGHFALAGFLGLGDMAIIGREVGAIFLLGLERENDVVGGNRLAVVPFGFGANAVGDPGVIVGMAHRVGQQAVFGGDLVEGRGHQRFVEQIRAQGEVPFTNATTSLKLSKVPKPDRRTVPPAARPG